MFRVLGCCFWVEVEYGWWFLLFRVLGVFLGLKLSMVGGFFCLEFWAVFLG